MGVKGVRGFTLIELLLVLVILGILAAIVVPQIGGNRRRAEEGATVAQISAIKAALSTFEVDSGRYPTTEEGLEALVQAPAGVSGTWKGPYLEQLPLDGWGRPFIYRLGGEGGGAYVLLSLGADGEEGTGDDIHRNTRK